MRNQGSPSDSCISFHPGHCANLRAMCSLYDRPTLWSPADVEITVSMTEGPTLHVYSRGEHRSVYAHDLPAIQHLLRISPVPPGGASVGRANFHNGVIALPADPRRGAGLRCFSVSTEPLAPCIFERSADLARDFGAVTAQLLR